MPYNITFENNGCGVVVAWQGIVLGIEILAANTALYAKAQRHLLRYQIWDFSSVAAVKYSEDHLRGAAMQDQRAAQEGPQQLIAIVGSRELLQGAARRYAVYAKLWAGFESRAFTNMTQARAWLKDWQWQCVEGHQYALR